MRPVTVERLAQMSFIHIVYMCVCGHWCEMGARIGKHAIGSLSNAATASTQRVT